MTKKAEDLAQVLAELSPAGLDAVREFARKVREQERRGVQPLSGLSLEEFAERVQTAANRSPNGWPNPRDDKVFISRLFAEFDASGETTGMDLDAFKARLVEAQRARMISLSRCDLVEAADAADVERQRDPLPLRRVAPRETVA